MAERVSLSVSDSLISSGDMPADSKMIGAGRWERRVFRVWLGMCERTGRVVVVDSRSGRVVKVSCWERLEPWRERRKLVIAVCVELVALWLVSMV